MNEFLLGRKGNLSEDHKEIVTKVKEMIGLDFTFNEWSRQKCKDLFMSMSFRGKLLTWKDLPQDWQLEEEHGPYVYSTDFGACCFLAPHLNFEPTDWNKSFEEIYHGLEADALNGRANGLDLVLDAEQFNYAFYESNAAGFKISLHHHLDKPMIEFSSQLINIGTETQITLKPSVSYTTADAISRFKPEERGCFVEGEVNLTYLTYADGYRYESNNCVIDQGIRDIIWNCRCTPRIWPPWHAVYHLYGEFIEYCSGEGLYCETTRLKSLGLGKILDEHNIIVQDALKNETWIGNISKPNPINCIPACQEQENFIQMSYAPYPQRGNFFYQKKFCYVASHAWQITCQVEHRKYFLDLKQPNLCQTIEKFKNYFDDTSTCDYWPTNYFQDYKKPNDSLVDEMYQYGRDNLALIHVSIQNPRVTKIKRDVEMTLISYIANTGGLLGLCLGFSFISGIEVIFWCFCCCFKIKKKMGSTIKMTNYKNSSKKADLRNVIL